MRLDEIIKSCKRKGDGLRGIIRDAYLEIDKEFGSIVSEIKEKADISETRADFILRDLIINDEIEGRKYDYLTNKTYNAIISSYKSKKSKLKEEEIIESLGYGFELTTLMIKSILNREREIKEGKFVPLKDRILAKRVEVVDELFNLLITHKQDIKYLSRASIKRNHEALYIDGFRYFGGCEELLNSMLTEKSDAIKNVFGRNLAVEEFGIKPFDAKPKQDIGFFINKLFGIMLRHYDSPLDCMLSGNINKKHNNLATMIRKYTGKEYKEVFNLMFEKNFGTDQYSIIKTLSFVGPYLRSLFDSLVKHKKDIHYLNIANSAKGTNASRRLIAYRPLYRSFFGENPYKKALEMMLIAYEDYIIKEFGRKLSVGDICTGRGRLGGLSQAEFYNKKLGELFNLLKTNKKNPHYLSPNKMNSTPHNKSLYIFFENHHSYLTAIQMMLKKYKKEINKEFGMALRPEDIYWKIERSPNYKPKT